jgi:hypothetical protein
MVINIYKMFLKIILFPYKKLKIYFVKKLILKNKKILDQTKFNLIYKLNYWANNFSRSGSGSTMEYTYNLRKKLPQLIKSYRIRSILDCPCGDFFWMRNFLQKKKFQYYIGGDIVPDLIKENIRLYSNKLISFKLIDIRFDELPKADLLICRDLFIHFSYNDIRTSLLNFTKSKVKFILFSHDCLTNNFTNKDILTGEYRRINLFKKPFNLKNPLMNIKDGPQGNQSEFRIMSLFSKNQIYNLLK